jgi:2-hydroxychromene-2-carboxylate isomerase
MGRTVDYYFAPQSPWAYLGHQRLADIVQRTGATVRVMPIDLGGKVFPISGGLPLGQRAPQRQAYRLVELQRFSQHLNVPLNLKPRYFPVGGDDAARLIIATDLAHGAADAMAMAGAILAACWAQERNMADDKVLAELLKEQDLAADLLAQSHSQAVQVRYETYTQAAIDAGVFGAPSYVVDGEIFWGQDRLDFVERALARGCD